MTPEREQEIRHGLAPEQLWLGDAIPRSYGVDLLAALDQARAERDELKAESRIGRMSHFCDNPECGTTSFGSGYAGLCPGCDEPGRSIPA